MRYGESSGSENLLRSSADIYDRPQFQVTRRGKVRRVTRGVRSEANALGSAYVRDAHDNKIKGRSPTHLSTGRSPEQKRELWLARASGEDVSQIRHERSREIRRARKQYAWISQGTMLIRQRFQHLWCGYTSYREL